ncbi:MAG: gamma-glutamyl-gamma-aminobutyrate hydrolase family protein [Prolixibacteraceae bacterium]|jgi:putative glutamine amidotransferase|nr:gamma-glutamyl-gamma-aminobutyrate hydrolase family protein [Prolixibacteraceae bacterium]
MNFFLEHASAIVIGGGEDIHPSIYGKNEYVEVCGAFDLFRDSIEILLINYALYNKVPLPGICRGHQIMNALTGGTLIPDIPSFLETNIQHRSNSDSAHVILFSTNCYLNQLELDTLWVNSRHHQCVDQLSPKFNAIAFSPDNIVESIQIKTNFHILTQ